MRYVDNEGRRVAIRGYATKDRLKAWCRRVTSSAVRNGVLLKLPCEVCGSLNSEAHHTDYRRPLEVKWLCKAHHVSEHFGEVA